MAEAQIQTGPQTAAIADARRLYFFPRSLPPLAAATLFCAILGWFLALIFDKALDIAKAGGLTSTGVSMGLFVILGVIVVAFSITALLWMAGTIIFAARWDGNSLRTYSLFRRLVFPASESQFLQLEDDQHQPIAIIAQRGNGAWHRIPGCSISAADRTSLGELLANTNVLESPAARKARATLRASLARGAAMVTTFCGLILLLQLTAWFVSIVAGCWIQFFIRGAAGVDAVMLGLTWALVLFILIVLGTPAVSWLYKSVLFIRRKSNTWGVGIADPFGSDDPFKSSLRYSTLTQERDSLHLTALPGLEIKREHVRSIRMQPLWPLAAISIRMVARPTALEWDDGSGLRSVTLQADHGPSFGKDRRLDFVLHDQLAAWHRGETDLSPPRVSFLAPIMATLLLVAFWCLLPLHNHLVQTRLIPGKWKAHGWVHSPAGKLMPNSLVVSALPQLDRLALFEMPDDRALMRWWISNAGGTKTNLVPFQGVEKIRSIGGRYLLVESMGLWQLFQVPPPMKDFNSQTAIIDTAEPDATPRFLPAFELGDDVALFNGDLLFAAKARDYWSPGGSASGVTTTTLRDMWLVETRTGKRRGLGPLAVHRQENAKPVFFPDGLHVLAGNAVIDTRTGKQQFGNVEDLDTSISFVRSNDAFYLGDKLALRVLRPGNQDGNTSLTCEVWTVDPLTARAERIHQFEPGWFFNSADQHRWLAVRKGARSIEGAYILDHTTESRREVQAPENAEFLVLVKDQPAPLAWCSDGRFRPAKLSEN